MILHGYTNSNLPSFFCHSSSSIRIFKRKFCIRFLIFLIFSLKIISLFLTPIRCSLTSPISNENIGKLHDNPSSKEFYDINVITFGDPSCFETNIIRLQAFIITGNLEYKFGTRPKKPIQFLHHLIIHQPLVLQYG